MGPKQKAKLTRNQASVNFYGGVPQDLIETVIPTYRDIARYNNFIQERENISDLRYSSSKITEKLIVIWTNVSDKLPLLTTKSIEQKVVRYLAAVKNIQWKTGKNIGKTRQNLDEKLDKIFDICKCSCSLEEASCNDRIVKCKMPNCSHLICVCPVKVKI